MWVGACGWVRGCMRVHAGGWVRCVKCVDVEVGEWVGISEVQRDTILPGYLWTSSSALRNSWVALSRLSERIRVAGGCVVVCVPDADVHAH